MPALNPDLDPDGLLEYSVVFTDRSLNHMSQTFQAVMNNISVTLKAAYGADAVAIVPGGGTYAMEAVARQFAAGHDCMVIRNGFFSFRWSQILDMAGIAGEVTVMQARRVAEDDRAPFAPAPLEEVVQAIAAHKPAVVFAPHVETASGMLLPDEYIAAVAAAARANGGLFVLDCIASGALWVDMRALGVDVLISAPQKGWSATPCAGLVMLGARALDILPTTTSSSFACDLARWLQIMQAYEAGGHAYHATLPTDGLSRLNAALEETRAAGFETLRAQQIELGTAVRKLLAERGFDSVAASGFQAPGVVVCYTDDPDLQNGSRFKQAGLQIAAGVPLQCGEGDGFSSFRIGLFGLDKLNNVERTVASLKAALDTL